MFSERHFPNQILPEKLDEYLAKGWYRMGQTIFTTHFLFFHRNLYSAIWTRLPLKGYKFRKRLRKIMNRNQRRFQTVIRPADLNAEKEALFQAYKKNFPEFQSPTLADYLGEGRSGNIFNSMEACVYDGDRLAAFSIFDLGANSMASIVGVYSPDYQSFSLGFYTLLLEIAFGLENGFEFYYPGYIVPGRPKFDYKRRIGTPDEVEFFDLRTSEWLPLIYLNEQEIPVNKITRKLGKVHTELRTVDILSQMLYYPSYDWGMTLFDPKYRLDAPIFLSIFPDKFVLSPKYVVSYHFWKDTWSLCTAMRFEDLAFSSGKHVETDWEKHRLFMDAILKKETLIESDDYLDIVGAIIRIYTQYSRNK